MASKVSYYSFDLLFFFSKKKKICYSREIYIKVVSKVSYVRAPIDLLHIKIIKHNLDLNNSSVAFINHY